MTQQNDVILVKDVMVPEVEMINGLATVNEALQDMKQKQRGTLIIERRDEHDEYGFVTVSDIAKHMIEDNLSPERVHVYEIMSKPVVSVRPNMNIRYAIRLLEQICHTRALVIDDGSAVGIVTMYDMVIRYMESH